MKLPKAKITKTEYYKPGLSIFKKKKVKIKLSANECALGPSPKAIREYINGSKTFIRYPDSEGILLRKSLAKKFNLDFDRIILGAGSDQILEFVCKSFLNKNDEVIIPEYSFIVYRIYSKINNAKVVFVKEKKFSVSVKNILSKVTKKTKIVFLANPNNPTGTYINKNDLITLRKKLRSDILLVVDDAYCEYINSKNYISGLKLFSKSKNVLVTRTFSKIYGLAGLRIGWGYSSKSIIKSLKQIKPPFNVSRPALLTAVTALKDNKWIKKEIKHVNKWRKILFKSFKEMKIEVNEGSANFLLINFDKVKINSSKVFIKLANAGILVRNMNNYGIKNSLRVTIGKAQENKKFTFKLRKIINV